MQALNVVVLPDTLTKEWIVTTSTKVHEQYHSEFIVDGSVCQPHISLYQSEYEEGNGEAVKAALSTIAQNTTAFPLSLIRATAFGSTLFCEVGRSPKIQALQEKIISVLNPLRDPLYHTRLGDISNAPPYFLGNAKKYGYVFARRDFLPHITITAFKTPEEAEVAKNSITVPFYSFKAHAMYLTNIDHHGTCTKIYGEFPFSG